MIYLELFLTFLKIGAFTFGGGYAMLPLIQDSVVSNGWLTAEEMLNYIAISESTPGPIAINMATFVGMSQGGLLGALMCTIGVVLPAFVIILLVSCLISNLLNYTPVKKVLDAIKPIVCALILATVVTLFLTVILGVTTFNSEITFDYLGLIILSVLALIYGLFYFWKKKPLSPIMLIVLSGIMGVIFYI